MTKRRVTCHMCKKRERLGLVVPYIWRNLVRTAGTEGVREKVTYIDTPAYNKQMKLKKKSSLNVEEQKADMHDLGDIS